MGDNYGLGLMVLYVFTGLVLGIMLSMNFGTSQRARDCGKMFDVPSEDDEKSKVAKATSTGNRIIHVHAPEVHYKAKSRTIPYRFPVVSFDNPADDSIWKFLFDEVWRDIPEEGSGE